MQYKRLCSYENYKKNFEKNLNNDFLIPIKCSNYGSNKFISVLRKVFYPYEHIDDWEKFNATSLLEKKSFTVS